MSEVEWEDVPVATTKTIFPEQLIEQIAEADDKIAYLEARLSEAVKVLEPIVATLTASEEHAKERGKDTDAVSDDHEVTSFSAVPNLTLGHLRAAKAFITTLGGEKE